MARSIQSDEKQGPTTKIIQQSYHLEWKGKVFPRYGKAKGVHHHQVLIIWNV